MNRSLALAASRTWRFRARALLASFELLSGFAAGLDDAGELALVLGGEQRHLADVVEVEANGIIHVSYNHSILCGIPV